MPGIFYTFKPPWRFSEYDSRHFYRCCKLKIKGHQITIQNVRMKILWSLRILTTTFISHYINKRIRFSFISKGESTLAGGGGRVILWLMGKEYKASSEKALNLNSGHVLSSRGENEVISKDENVMLCTALRLVNHFEVGFYFFHSPPREMNCNIGFYFVEFAIAIS